MKLPKSVKVGGHIIKVLPTPRAQINCDAFYDRARNEIGIDLGLDHYHQATALLHEVLHACWAESGLVGEFKGRKVEEKVVRHFEPFLYQFLRDNPKAVRFLCHSVK